MGFPVVLKIVSPDIPHKTEAGGVLAGLAMRPRSRPATTPSSPTRALQREARIIGVLVQQMLPAAAR